jgi:hypothetical protein
VQPACIRTVTAPGWPLMPAPASCSSGSLRAASSRLSGPSSSRCGPYVLRLLPTPISRSR